MKRGIPIATDKRRGSVRGEIADNDGGSRMSAFSPSLRWGVPAGFWPWLWRCSLAHTGCRLAGGALLGQALNPGILIDGITSWMGSLPAGQRPVIKGKVKRAITKCGSGWR